jgi:hypothetical protein
MRKQPTNRSAVNMTDNKEVEKTFYTVFQNAMNPYLQEKEYWDKWCKSEKCPLKENELELIKDFLLSQNMKDLAKMTRMKKKNLQRQLNLILLKLLNSVFQFERWKKETDEAEDFPLGFPIGRLKMSKGLSFKLCSLGESLAEILKKFSADDLEAEQGFSRSEITELHRFLESYKFGHWLRRKMPVYDSEEFSDLALLNSRFN